MSGKMIMLVEDNPADEELTLRALKKHNLVNQVVVARDGAEALDYLFSTGAYSGREPGPLPAVILLDLNLPKVNGMGVLQRLRANPTTRLIPVVMLTSSSEEHDLLRSYDLGVNSFITKPVDFMKFVEAIEQLSLYWLVLNEQPPGVS